MTKELADKIEQYLKETLHPEHGYILIVGETETSNSGIITNYSGKDVTKILRSFSAISYQSDDADVRNN